MFHVKQDALDAARTLAAKLTMSPSALAKRGIAINQDGVPRSALQLLAYPDVGWQRLQALWPALAATPQEIADQLAIDTGLQGQKLGGVLLFDAVRKVRDLSDTIGIRAIVVDAIDQRAREFSLHHEFIAFADDPDRLFIPLRSVSQVNRASATLGMFGS